MDSTLKNSTSDDEWTVVVSRKPRKLLLHQEEAKPKHLQVVDPESRRGGQGEKTRPNPRQAHQQERRTQNPRQTRQEEQQWKPVDVRRPPKKLKKAIVVEAKNKDEDDEEEEENMEVELTKYPTSADPAKMAKMQRILSQFTEDQMSRYESFRRSALQKPSMKRLLQNVTGSQKIINTPMTIVACGIAKMFVGELVEKARVVMGERNESGPIRPCHIRESYRRLKLEGKVPKRSVPRLFR